MLPPVETGKQVLGVILEIPVGREHDLVAAYPNRTARYWNHSGAGIVWEAPNETIGESIELQIAAATVLVGQIGPWEGARPDLPPPGTARINVLTPLGLQFGQGPFNLLSADPLARPVIDAGTAVMKSLIEHTNRTSEKRPPGRASERFQRSGGAGGQEFSGRSCHRPGGRSQRPCLPDR